MPTRQITSFFRSIHAGDSFTDTELGAMGRVSCGVCKALVADRGLVMHMRSHDTNGHADEDVALQHVVVEDGDAKSGMTPPATRGNFPLPTSTPNVLDLPPSSSQSFPPSLEMTHSQFLQLASSRHFQHPLWLPRSYICRPVR